MSGPYDNCVSVTPECPVEASYYSYRPNLGVNVFFITIFGVMAAVQFILGIKWKTWTFLIALVLGCICEMVGYAGRIMLSENPWSNTGFIIQICCLILAPAFISAGIYLTLKHFVLVFGEEFSVLRPSLYTWIFISADIFCLVLQGAGGGIEATASTDTLIQTGSNLALAGIVVQVVSLVIFGVLFGLYFARVWGNRERLSVRAKNNARATPFRLFFGAIILAYLAILTRCVYRIPEISGGWQNSVMLNQVDFVVLDNTMVTIATLALTILHPGFCFNALSKVKRNDVEMNPKQVGSGRDDELSGAESKSRY